MDTRLKNTQLVEDFLSYLTVEKDDSPLTVLSYGDDIKRFTEYLTQKIRKRPGPR